MRRGFTLVELLVVIAVFGLLMVLLIPAIQGGREAVKKSHCQNNLRQISLAMMIYHHEWEILPPGYVSTLDRDGRERGPGWGFLSFLLPNMEQTSLSRAMHVGQPVSSPDNRTVVSSAMNLFLCMTEDEEAQEVIVETDSAPRRELTACRVTSYIGSFGSGDLADEAARGVGNGLFYRNSHLNLDQVTDGTSTTFLLGERRQRESRAIWAGTIDERLLGRDAKGRAVILGPSLILGSTGGDPGPNARPSRPGRFSSGHPGGAYFAFADASVRFVRSNAGAAIYRSLATRAGGEILGTDDGF